MNKMDKIKITNPNAKETFKNWIANRGGVQIWDNINLSNPEASAMYTPALNTDGTPTEKPSWKVTKGERVTDMGRFEFITLAEIARFHVALRRSENGLNMKLTDASARKLNKKLKKYNTPYYHFDYGTQEAVITKEVTP